MSYKLGKLDATRDDRDRLFCHYKARHLPQAPIGYDHTGLVTDPWGMLGNDRIGDCAIAGPAHEHMLTSAMAGKRATFTEKAVIGVYSAITGYDPKKPDSDQGSVVRDVLRYRAATGMTDAEGNVHKVGAYVALRPGDWTELMEALYLFGAVGIGIQVPESAQEQFEEKKPWVPVPGSPVEGGHYVPVVSRPAEAVANVVTWGGLQGMSRSFYHHFCDEAWAILSPEALTNGKSLEGFDLTQLTADLAELRS